MLSPAEFAATVLDNPYIPLQPTLKQARFLARDEREVMYGGAARGGKSIALLMAALQYAELPNYRALILRRSYADLTLPNSLIPWSRQWLTDKAEWNSQAHTWTFPSGAVLAFGYLQSQGDEYRYKSSDYSFIGFDELTQFSEEQYTYLFSRLTKASGSDIPTRMRCASNPGDIGHDWVKARFIALDGQILATQGRAFVPARLVDNPHIDQGDYVDNLNKLDAVRRAQLMYGDWDVALSGGMFQRDKIHIIDRQRAPDPKHMKTVRRWDLAATRPSRSGDPDFSVGLRYAEWHGEYYVVDLQRFREAPARTEEIVRQTAEVDGVAVPIRMEQEPGSSGKITIDHYARYVLPGYDFKGVPSTGDKATRAGPVASAVGNGLVHIFHGPWNADFLNELAAFPKGAHDDIVDALSGAHSDITGKASGNPNRFGMIQTSRVSL